MIQTMPKTVVFALSFFLPSSLLVNANRQATRNKQYRALQGNEAHQRQQERLPSKFQETQRRYHYEELTEYRTNDRKLSVSGRTGPGFPAPGFGEMGPDSIPDLVVDHHAKQDEISVNNKNNSSPTVPQASNETTFPGLSAYDRNVNRIGSPSIRMRGNTVTANFQRGTGLNWGSYNRDRSGGNPKVGKSDKSYSYSSRGCYRRGQKPLPAKSYKNSKDDGNGGYYDCPEGNGDDDDDNGGSWENSNDEHHDDGSHGGSSYPDNDIVYGGGPTDNDYGGPGGGYGDDHDDGSYGGIHGGDNDHGGEGDDGDNDYGGPGGGYGDDHDDGSYGTIHGGDNDHGGEGDDGMYGGDQGNEGTGGGHGDDHDGGSYGPSHGGPNDYGGDGDDGMYGGGQGNGGTGGGYGDDDDGGSYGDGGNDYPDGTSGGGQGDYPDGTSGGSQGDYPDGTSGGSQGDYPDGTSGGSQGDYPDGTSGGGQGDYPDGTSGGGQGDYPDGTSGGGYGGHDDGPSHGGDNGGGQGDVGVGGDGSDRPSHGSDNDSGGGNGASGGSQGNYGSDGSWEDGDDDDHDDGSSAEGQGEDDDNNDTSDVSGGGDNDDGTEGGLGDADDGGAGGINGGAGDHGGNNNNVNGSDGDAGDGIGSNGDNASGGNSSEGSSGHGNGGSVTDRKGLCETFDVAFATGNEDSVIFLTGAANEPSAQGVAALVEIFKPPVLLSQSTGYAVTIVFLVDTSKAKASDDKNGDALLTEEDVALTLDEAISAPVALEVVGCTDAAMEKAGEYYEANKVDNEDYRRLEVFDSKLVILRDWLCVNGNCNRNGGNNCELQCSNDVFYFGTLSSGEVRESIKAALIKYMMLLDDVTNWYPTGQTPTIDIELLETTRGEGEVNSVEGGEVTTRESAKAGPYIGAAAGVLALLLLLILLVRRSRRSNDDEEVSHLKLQEDDDNDTFMQEMASEGTPDRKYQSRGAHVLGENDSVYSNWTGYTGKKSEDNGYGNGLSNRRIGHHNTDVHQCSSATCEVCERQRQQGVSFIATRAPPRPGMLPNDARREYTAEDTIAL